MSRDSCNNDRDGSDRLSGLYRDRENGWLFGVCAGIADYADVRPATVRLIVLVSLFFFFWTTTIAYAAAALLVRQKPLTWSGRCREYDFWRRHKAHDHWSHS